MKRIASYTLLLLLLFSSCHRKQVPSASPRSGGSETGLASFYAESFNGKKTANGETYYSSKLTAAHKTLPFGTLVKVTNLGNGKSVNVRINDRGPFVAGRIIDLTRAAAREIDMEKAGVAKVTIRY